MRRANAVQPGEPVGRRPLAAGGGACCGRGVSEMRRRGRRGRPARQRLRLLVVPILIVLLKGGHDAEGMWNGMMDNFVMGG